MLAARPMTGSKGAYMLPSQIKAWFSTTWMTTCNMQRVQLCREPATNLARQPALLLWFEHVMTADRDAIEHAVHTDHDVCRAHMCCLDHVTCMYCCKLYTCAMSHAH